MEFHWQVFRKGGSGDISLEKYFGGKITGDIKSGTQEVLLIN